MNKFPLFIKETGHNVFRDSNDIYPKKQSCYLLKLIKVIDYETAIYYPSGQYKIKYSNLYGDGQNKRFVKVKQKQLSGYYKFVSHSFDGETWGDFEINEKNKQLKQELIALISH